METAKAVRIGKALSEADLVIIGASNGLDMAEGLNLFCADAISGRRTAISPRQTASAAYCKDSPPGCRRTTPMAERLHQRSISNISPARS